MITGADILVGILGNLVYDVIKNAVQDIVGCEDDPIIQKIGQSIDSACKRFFAKYGDSFGKPEESFLARRENWDKLISLVRYDQAELMYSDFNPTDYSGAHSVTPEAIVDLLAFVKEEMYNDVNLAKILAGKLHFQEATNMAQKISNIEQQLQEISDNFKVTDNRYKKDQLDVTELKKIAIDLLSSFQPPSLLPLFPDASDSVKRAINSIEWENRKLVEQVFNGKQPQSLRFKDIIKEEGRKHLIIANGGAGKTHSLWHLARAILERGGYIPVYIDLSGFSSCEELIVFIKRKLKNDNVALFVEHPAIIFFLDGWSQFSYQGSINGDAERQKLLAFMGDAKIFAAGRYSSSYDMDFTIWRLESLTEEVIGSTLQVGGVEISHSNWEDIRQLLGLPLALILYMLLGGPSTTRGELLSSFHKYLTQQYPDRANLLKVIGKAAANVVLIHKSMRKDNLEEEVSNAANQLNVDRVMTVIEKVGTLGNRRDVIQPVHDLYWEWLVGVGILNEWDNLRFLSACAPSVRNGIVLALESGQKLTFKDIEAIYDVDIVFSSMFLPYTVVKSLEEQKIRKHLLERIETLIVSPELVNRYRGIVAALIGKSQELFPMVLNTISNLRSQGFHLWELEKFFDFQFLWDSRAIISEWLGDNPSGKYYILAGIRRSANDGWVDWLEEQYIGRKITKGEAIETALACTSTLPQWILYNLSSLIKEKQAYCLRTAIQRGDNIKLAQWVAENYANLATDKTTSAWYDLNEILVNCGNDIIFESLFERFDTFDSEIRELILYAFEKRGKSWIVRLQEKYLNSQSKHLWHRQLLETVTSGVADLHARAWTESHEEKLQILGWKALAKKYQNRILPELINQLPDSFNNLHIVPALKAMKELDNPPEKLTGELWSRLRGIAQPMLMDDMLSVLARIRPLGIVSVVRELKSNTGMLPGYHLARFLTYLIEWEQRTGLKIQARSVSGEISFAEYLVLEYLRGPQMPQFVSQLIEIVPHDTVLTEIVTSLRAGNTALYKELKSMSSLKAYYGELVSYLFELPNSQGIKDIFQWFNDSFHTFPVTDLLELLQKIEDSEKQQELFNQLLYQVSRNPNANHRKVHDAILDRIMMMPETANHEYETLSHILNIYTPEIIRQMLEPYLKTTRSRVLWLIRLIEKNSNRLLMTETSEWIKA